jgi:hypothetical protein
MGALTTLVAPEGISLQATDVSGQKAAVANGVPTDSTVGELIQGLLVQMNLPRNDVSGRSLTYHARLEREGRHLHADERVGDALRPRDRIVLQPNIDAGAYCVLPAGHHRHSVQPRSTVL